MVSICATPALVRAQGGSGIAGRRDGDEDKGERRIGDSTERDNTLLIEAVLLVKQTFIERRDSFRQFAICDPRQTQIVILTSLDVPCDEMTEETVLCYKFCLRMTCDLSSCLLPQVLWGKELWLGLTLISSPSLEPRSFNGQKSLSFLLESYGQDIVLTPRNCFFMSLIMSLVANRSESHNVVFRNQNPANSGFKN